MNFVLKLAAAISVFHLLVSGSHGALIGQLGVLDSASNNGINPTTGVAWKVGDAYRLTFITSTGIDGTSMNIADYDAHVQTLANSAGLGAGWKALVSTSAVSARDNTGTNPTSTGVGIFLMDGLTMVASNNSQLWNGSISGAILLDEAQAVKSTSAKVFTGTSSSGVAGLAMGSGGNATIGFAGNTAKWIDAGKKNETDVYQIYAVSDVLFVAESIPEPSSVIMVACGAFLCLRRKRSE